MIYKLKRIIRAVKKAWKVPLIRLHSYSWKTGDHAHICIAARLLAPDDFVLVCPLGQKCKIYAEQEEECDLCPYYRILEFHSSELGDVHTITLF